ncbi:MAG: hypothetical protein K2X55_23545 [Burkholderiaceae bacterium]|nr:hypothetical protein [Burkholderiaceae bacterium]
MMGAQPLWWLALPVLLLPLWWHRQKRRRTEAEPLATARFLPSAPPQHRRIWRWDEVPLLLLRCLLLLALIAWLAAVALPWRGDTVFVGPDVPAAWADQQAAQAGMAGAQRMALPLTEPANAVLPWLQSHEHAWRKDAKLLVLAQQVALPAQLPKLAHAVEIRIAPAATAVPEQAGAASVAQAGNGMHDPAAPVTRPTALPTAPPTALPIALVAPPERKAAWHALFAAFDAAGNGAVRHVVTEFDGTQAPSQAPPRAALIVWDRAAPPPPGWQAPLWWLPTATLPLVAGVDPAAVQALRVDGLALQVADSARGRLWASDAWPPQDADGARTLYETWHALHFAPDAWPLAAQVLPPQRTSALAMPDTRPDAWLAYALLFLFMFERLVTHVRRR